MNDFKYVVDWDDLSMVFDTMEGAIIYAKSKCKEISATIIDEHYGDINWTDFYIKYSDDSTDNILIKLVKYCAE